MRCDVVAIGTELLLGQIVDTNSAWLGEHLALEGIDSLTQTKVGDNMDRIVDAIEAALERSDAVICCGGLGPTQDDLTRSALSAVTGSPLVLDEDRADLIRSMFGSRGRDMPDNNLLQAQRPESAEFLAHQPGTAPGLRCEVERGGRPKVVFAVPGVPWEMKEMFSEDIAPDLRARSGAASVIRSRTLRTWGQSESGLAEMLAGHMADLDAAGGATLAFLASGIEGIKVRVTVKAATAAAADAAIAEEERRLRRTLGELVFGIDDQTMESVVLDLCRGSGLSLAVAESLTGGLIASRLVDVVGASDVFRGGVVAYDPAGKRRILGVPEGPVISVDCAEAMARGVRDVFDSDIGIGVTGVAGPDPQEGRRVGTVCMAVDVEGDVTSLEVSMPGRRRQIREFTCISVLNLVRSKLVGRSVAASGSAATGAVSS